MYRQKKLFQQAGILLLMSFSSTALFAGGIATEQVSGSLSLSPTVSYDSASLRVSSDNYVNSQSYTNSESINMDLQGLDDGIYSYSLMLVTEAEKEGGDVVEVSQSGHVRIVNGYAEAYNDKIADAEAEAERVANLPVDTDETN